MYVDGVKAVFLEPTFRLKVEGAKTNILPKTNTYKRLPIANTLRPWTVPHGVGVSGPTEWWL
jgi:hypothetical protein